MLSKYFNAILFIYYFLFFSSVFWHMQPPSYARLQRQTKDFMGHTQDLSPLTFSFIPIWSKKGLEHICMMVSHPAWSLFCHYSGNKQSCQSGTLYQLRVHLKMCKQQQDRETSFSIYLADREDGRCPAHFSEQYAFYDLLMMLLCLLWSVWLFLSNKEKLM